MLTARTAMAEAAMAEAAVTDPWDGVAIGASLATLDGDAGYGQQGMDQGEG